MNEDARGVLVLLIVATAQFWVALRCMGGN